MEGPVWSDWAGGRRQCVRPPALRSDRMYRLLAFVRATDSSKTGPPRRSGGCSPGQSSWPRSRSTRRPGPQSPSPQPRPPPSGRRSLEQEREVDPVRVRRGREVRGRSSLQARWPPRAQPCMRSFCVSGPGAAAPHRRAVPYSVNMEPRPKSSARSRSAFR